MAIALSLASCATEYQPQSFTGGYSDYLTAPNQAVMVYRGNGYTDTMRLVEMTALRCAEVTLAHGYRYFVGIGVTDLSRQSSFTTPGYATTHAYGNVSGYSNFATLSGNSTTTFIPPQTFNFHKPALAVAIQMSNNEKSLEPLGAVIGGIRARPKDAAFLSQSLRQNLGIRNE